MDTIAHIEHFKNYVEKYCHTAFLKAVSDGHQSFTMEFPKLVEYNPDLAQDLLDHPTEVMKACEIAFENLAQKEPGNFHARFSHLPASQHLRIRDIRTKHLLKFFSMKGRIRQKSDVRPKITHSTFECPSCGSIIPILQMSQKFMEPSTCGCGRRGKFKLVRNKVIDAQGLVLEETMEELDGVQPRRINVMLTEDLTSPEAEKKTNPGTLVEISGIIEELPIIVQGTKQTRSDLILKANHVHPVEEDYQDILITPEDHKAFQKLAQDKRVYEKLISSMAPNIHGHLEVKEAILMQLAGGVRKRKTKDALRGDIHILLVGDPGSGKSQLLKRVSAIAPKARFVSGKGASGAGLTAAVIKDNFLQGWALEAGALVLASKGVCLIDELDKMTHEDRSAMHEGLEQQTISISKANIQATLSCQTTVLAAANPKFSRFDHFEPIHKQIDLPPSLLNRFDLIFPMKDIPHPGRDDAMAGFVLDLHETAQENNAELDPAFLRKYLAYARSHEPKLTREAKTSLRKYYVQMRNSGKDGKQHAVSISPRQLDALVRLSEGSAKLRLSKTVNLEDAHRAIGMLSYCLTSIGIDPETGQIDIDRIDGTPASQRDRIQQIKQLITQLEKVEGKEISYETVRKAAAAQAMEENMLREILSKLTMSGDIYEPKPGMIKRI